MKPKVSRLLFTAPIFISLLGHVSAADITKSDNLNNLNLGTSWALGSVPGANDFAVWNSSVLGANTTLLGANLTWKGIKILDPGGLATIGAGSTLTLLGGGIDMSAATQDLTINAGIALGNTTNGSFAQTWDVATGRTLTVAAVPVRNANANNLSVGGVLNITGAGTTKIGTVASALIVDGGGNPFVTINANDWAATDATGKVIAATYVNFASAGALSGAGNYNVTGSGAFTMNAQNPASVRFDNTGGAVTVAMTSTNTLRGVLMSSGAQAVAINSNFIRPNRVSTAGATMSFIQNSVLGDLTIQSNISNASSSTPVAVTKSGIGKMIFTGGMSYSGRTFIHEGTLQIGAGGTAGSLASTAEIFNNGNLTLNRSNAVSLSNVISGTGSLTQAGGDTLTLSGINTYTGATNLNAGTVAFNAATNLGSGGAINFNGGTLLYGGSHTTDISSRAISVGAGGGTINTGGNEITFASSIGSSGAGGLTKSGAGTLTLSNGSSYSGNTIISTGAVVANGSMAGGASVGNGASLGGAATYGGTITVNSGGIIAPGNSVGTITTNALTLGSGSILNFEFNTSPANDYINVTGSGGLTLNGGGFNLYVEGGESPFSTNGSYNLIGYTGGISGTGIGALSVLNPQPGKNYTFGSTESNVTLGIEAAGFVSNWNVGAGGSWGTADNWSAGVPDAVGATANFTFAIGAPETVTLDGTKTVGGLSLDSAQGYTIAEGSGGTLTLDHGASQANIIGTTGSHTVSAAVALHSSTVAAIGSGSTLTVSGAVGGSSNLTKSGAGTLDLTNTSNSMSGDVSVAGGTLGFAAAGSLGSGTNIALESGTLRYNAGNTDDISTKTITLSAGGGTINTNGNDVTFANAIGNSGIGGLTKAGAGTLTLGGMNTQTGATTITGGTLAISSNRNLGDGTTGAGLTLNGGTLRTSATLALDNAGANFRSVTISAGGGTLSTDSATTLTIGGSVSGSAELTKSGDGLLVLSGNNSTTLSSAIRVTAGTLRAGGTQANGTLGLGTGAISLGNGTTLSSNGVGASDNATSYGNLTNALFVASGNTANLALAKRITISSTLTGAGTLNVGIDGNRQDYQGNWGAFTGQINLTGAGEFHIANFQNNVFNNSKLNIGAGVHVFQTFNPATGTGTETVQNIGELSGAAGSILGGQPVGGRFVNWSVGGLNTNSSFSGTIQNDTDSTNGFGEAKLTKVGTGTLTLGGTSTYTGVTTVSAGTLLVNGGLGDTAVAVNNGGTLGGSNGSIGSASASVTVNSGGTLAPGNSAGTLTVTGSTTLNSGSTYAYEYTGNATAADLLDVNGTLTIDTGAILTLLDLGTYTLGDKFTLFAYESLIGSFGAYADDQEYSFNGGAWMFNYNDTTAGVNGGSITGGVGSGFVTITAVPEPSAAMLAGGLGMLGLLRRRREA
jgi:autotransporter-associated beta strand protein